MGLPHPLSMDLLAAEERLCPLLSSSEKQMLLQPNYLTQLSILALSPHLTVAIYHHFAPIFPDLVARWDVVQDRDALLVAFAIILPIDRHLKTFAQRYLSDNPKVFSKINPDDMVTAVFDIQAVDVDYLRNMLLAVYRLIIFDYQEFKHLAHFSTILSFLRHPDRAVRFLVVHILCILTNAADAARDSIIEKHVGKESIIVKLDGLETSDLTLLLLLERRRINSANKAHQTINHFTKFPSDKLAESELSANIVNICGVLVPRFSPPQDTQIVFTPTTKLNLQNVANALLSNEPILLHGTAGCGKSFIIEQISKILGRFDGLASCLSFLILDVVRIHLNEQTDVKLLLGTYVSTKTPGSFEWKAGILTTAVQLGKWIIIEDVDRSPNDILSVLLPLMESRCLSISSRGDKIHAGRGFQLFGTTVKDDWSENAMGSRLWKQIHVVHPECIEWLEIVKSRYPRFGGLSEIILRVFEAVKDSTCKAGLGRMITTRDLIKWSNRVNSLFETHKISAGEAVSTDVYDIIFQEACDCFAGMSQSPWRQTLVEQIGRVMELPCERSSLYASHIPRYHLSEGKLDIGRASLVRYPSNHRPSTFANTNHALRLLEQLACAVKLNEPILLVGETGTGKTAVVQHLTHICGHNLVAINLSQQTESGDLLGGFKPIDSRVIAIELKEKFDQLFNSTFSTSKTANIVYVQAVYQSFREQQWNKFIKLLRDSVKIAEKKLVMATHLQKKRKVNHLDLLPQWRLFASEVESFEKSRDGFAFSFVEGTFVKALRAGDWVLLDEINLAAQETIESISSLLQENPQIILSEKSDLDPIKPPPEFRLFACMNPATDIGKRDLPPGLRSRFTEIYVASPDEDVRDLVTIVKKYIGGLTITDERICIDTAHLYLFLRNEARLNKIVDGAGRKPHFSIRTLSRTLMYVCDMASIYSVGRSLYEGFCMSFLTLLDKESESLILPIIEKTFLGSPEAAKGILNQVPRCPHSQNFVQFEHYWMPRGDYSIEEQDHYIITPFIKKNMLNLSRAIATRRFPILIQGPTSTGKTSMISYIAKKTGHKLVRINNHEHTDLQEYIGTYVSDEEGKLVFAEGILVEALRKGYWIVLDELNLAPSDVLEALNRLLDDNRELLIPETLQLVKPHPKFMLFATQNPPGLYGGRKYLSRAFRNRFLELHFDDIPEEDLQTILCQSCKIAPSYCSKIVQVYKQLAIRRQSTRLFEQKNSFATLRDLFRWAYREAIGYQQLAENGYMLLAERVRRDDEREAVKSVIEEVMRVTIDESVLYNCENLPEFLRLNDSSKNCLVWTRALKRMFTLIVLSLRYREPVLLVGETGCGKTSVCQIVADAFGRKLHTLNAHQNTETGDIIGSQRPFRQVQDKEHDVFADAHLPSLLQSYQLDREQVSESLELVRQGNKSRKLFEWQDGCLVRAMKEGGFFLLDEISLAEDSVLERLNSVLEQGRTIVLAERGADSDEIVAADEFQFLATMNPGGDYGKRELSPALRNRFTEIWVPAITEQDDIKFIVQSRLVFPQYASVIVHFSSWFVKEYSLGAMTSIRDILSWTNFVNSTVDRIGIQHSFFSGAAMVFIDSLGTNLSSRLARIPNALHVERSRCYDKLAELMQCEIPEWVNSPPAISPSDSVLNFGMFEIHRGPMLPKPSSFNMNTPTTALNAMRVARALVVGKPILLEGCPGVGKTSLISAIAEASGHHHIRINLSEQTDLMDLLGSDVPVEGGRNGEFTWRDAPFLQAMKQGYWVLLDEMNLASQSVLEGLNSCLDHRGESYIPELGKSFCCHPQFRVFAAQNPHDHGDGRKGLPKSFVNRFTVVYVDPLTRTDMMNICLHVYPQVGQPIVSKIVDFVTLLNRKTAVFGREGAPWEFNLRDVIRWLELLSSKNGLIQWQSPLDFLDIIIKQRFRTKHDQEQVDALCFETFSLSPKPRNMYHNMTNEVFQVGQGILERSQLLKSSTVSYFPLVSQFLPIELMMVCVQQNWPVILVGSSGSGKTSMIRFLASVVGAHLEEFSLNSDVDSMDLLGGFEQVDVYRKIQQFLDEVRELIITEFVSSRFMHTSRILEFLSATSTNMDKISEVLLDIAKLLETSPNPSEQAMAAKARTLCQCIKDTSFPGFEWLDGILVRAVKQGKWLVLDNANLCSPSVLDRLNSLLEPKGQLIEQTQIVPHKDFRIFFTVNPRYGELSRAMRNRGIEIYIPSIVTPDKHFGQIESDFYRIHSLEKVLASFQSHFTNPSMVSMVYRSLIDFFPCVKNMVFQSWQKSLGYEFTLYEAVVQHPLAKDIEKYYREVQRYLRLPSSYVLVQSINSINNPLIIPPLSVDSQLHVRSFQLYLVYEILCLWKSMSDLIEHYRLQSRTKMLSTMTFLERSLSLLENRLVITYDSPEVARLITLVVQKTDNWLSRGDYLYVMQADLCVFREFLITLKHLLISSASEHFDPSHLYTYRTLLERTLQKDTSLASLDLETLVCEFSQVLELKRGLSMKCLWSAFHIDRPTNETAWRFFEESLLLLSQFDKAVSMSLDLGVVIRAKTTFITAIAESIRSSKQSYDWDSLKNIKTLTAQLMTLKVKSSESVSQTQAFRALLQYRLLFPDFSNCALQNMELFHLSGVSSVELLSIVLSMDKSILLYLLNRPNSSFTSESQIIRDDLAEWLSGETLALFLKNQNVIHSLRDTHDARSQNALIGQEIAYCAEFICCDKPESLTVKLHLEMSSKTPVVCLLFELESTGPEAIMKICQLIHQVPFESISYFSQLWRSHFSKAFELVEAFISEKESVRRLFLSGQVIIQFAKGLLLLYVPDKVYDPAMESIVEHRIYKDGCLAVGEELEVRRWIEANISGSFSPTIELLEQRMEKLLQESTSLNINCYRPQKSQITAIYRDIEQFMSIVISSSFLETLVSSLCSCHKNAILEAKLFRHTWNHFVEKLQNDYPYYIDLLEPFCQMVEQLILGVSLVACGTIWHLNDSDRNCRGLIFQDLLSVPHLLSSTRAGILQLVTEIDASSFGERYWLLQLQKDWFGIALAQSCQIDYIEQYFTKFLKNYRLKVQREEAAAANNLYRNGPNGDDSADTIEAVFPEETPGETVMELVCLHERLFGNPLLEDFESIIDESRSIFCDLIRENPIGITSQIEPLAVQVAIIGYSNHPKRHRIQRPYCFYKDGNYEEAERLRPHLLSFNSRLEQLLEIWPENAVLQDVHTLCGTLMDMPANSPLAAFLPKLERLYSTVDDWEKVASRQHSIKEFQIQFQNLIISWRRQELNSWSQLFDLEDYYCRKNDTKWWFHLYENCIRNPLQLEGSDADLISHVSDLSSIVCEFLQSSSKGQFETRLSMVQAFHHHAKEYHTLYPEFQKISDMLGNITSLHLQFKNEVQKSILEQRSILEKDISEIAKLASWRDTNVFALQESSRKSHRNLCKVVKKYREVLQQPVSIILEAGVLEPSGSSTNSFSISPKIPKVLLPTYETVIKLPPRLIDIDRTINIMWRVFHDSFTLVDPSVSDCLEMFTDSLLKNVGLLQTETPAFLTLENKSAVKNLKVRKHKLFVDSIRQVRQWGVKSNIAADTIKSQASVSELVSSIPYSTSTQVNYCKRMNNYFFAILENIPRFRTAALGHSTDLTHSEIRRASGMFEHLLSMVLDERRVVVSSLSNFETVQQTLEKIHELTSDGAVPIVTNPSSIKKIEGQRSSFRLLPFYLHDIIYTVKCHNNLSALDNYASLVETLVNLQSEAEYRCKNFSEMATSTLKISNCNQFTLMDDCIAFLQYILSFVTKWMAGMPVLNYVFQPFSDWISEVVSSTQLQGIEKVSDQALPLKDLEAELQELCDSVLVSLQQICPSLNRLTRFSGLDEDKFKQSHAELLTLTKSLHLSTILNLLLKCINSTRSLNILPNHTELGRHASVLWSLTKPFVEQYNRIVEQLLSLICKQHSSVCKSVYILQKLFQDVARKGFCTPEAESDMKTTGLSNGTGLGDGEGATNISDDLPDQEELEDFAKETGENNKAEDKKDDALDVDADFEADLESIEERDSSDEEEELEDGVGDVDDLDPSAVDEKLWDGKGKDDSLEGKNQDSKEQNGQSDVTGTEDTIDYSKDKKSPESQREEEEKSGEEEEGNEDRELEHREQEDVSTQRIPEAEIMDLPDDIDFGQNDEMEGEDNVSDMDMEGFSDKNLEDEELESDNQKQMEEESFEQEGQDSDFGEDSNDIGKSQETMDVGQERHDSQSKQNIPSEDPGNEQLNTHNEPMESEDPGNNNEPIESKDPRHSAAENGQSGQTNSNLEQTLQRDSKPDPLRQLGEALEEWKRQIAQPESSEITGEIDPSASQSNELEHIQNDETVYDTQALGPATQAQAQILDDTMVDDTKMEQSIPVVDQDMAMESRMEATLETNELTGNLSGAIIGPSVNLDLMDEVNSEHMQESPIDYDTLPAQGCSRSFEESRAIWQKHELSTQDLASSLCEQLRLILEPTLATKMKGDFRTGKRLNMKRIIPYIASQFKKDKIWMRRTKPSKRQYQIMIAMDDSKSMAESESVRLAFETLCLVSKALTQLEAGSIAIASFGEKFKLVHPFHQPFTFEAGVKVCQQFGFSQVKTNLKDLAQQSISVFESAKSFQTVVSNLEFWQLEIIISDGVCEDHSVLRQLVRQAANQKIMMIFVIVDVLGGELKKDSIMNMNSVRYVTTNDGQMKLEMTRYIDTFPFQYYVLVRDIRELPGVLSSALRQWFMEISQP